MIVLDNGCGQKKNRNGVLTLCELIFFVKISILIAFLFHGNAFSVLFIHQFYREDLVLALMRELYTTLYNFYTCKGLHYNVC